MALITCCLVHQGKVELEPFTLLFLFLYNYLENSSNDLIGLAIILARDTATTTQIYTQKPLPALRDEIERDQFI